MCENDCEVRGAHVADHEHRTNPNTRAGEERTDLLSASLKSSQDLFPGLLGFVHQIFTALCSHSLRPA
jgi:hypothetical protein